MAKISGAQFAYIVFFTGLLQFIGSLFYFVWFGDASYIQLMYTGTKVVMLVIPLIMIALGLRLPPFSLRPNNVILGMITGMAMAGLILGVYALFQSSFIVFAPAIASKVAEAGILPYYSTVAIVMSLGHSLFEEYFWRWYVVRALMTRFAVMPSILLGNAVFALHHYVVLSQFFTWPLVVIFGTAVGIAGCIWSLLYQRTGSLLGAWISHALADIAIFIVGYLIVT